MSNEELVVDKSKSLDEQYELLLKQVKNLLSRDDKLITNLSNLTAAINQTFEKVSWVGFYLADDDEIYLGPFQGKIACTKIKIGSGVCGTSALKRETIIVEDVAKFPGHIACDVDSRSEIVVPLLKGDKLIGVLDLDSTSLSSFNQTDKKYLEQICKFLTREIL